MKGKKYIEVNELLKSFTPDYPADSDNKPIRIDLRLIKRIIIRQPIANVAEVKYGKWLPITNGLQGWKCSLCDEHIYVEPPKELNRYKYPFCPNCGADMKGGLK